MWSANTANIAMYIDNGQNENKVKSTFSINM